MNEKILKQIRRIRKERGISLKELSEKTELSYNYLSLLENEKKNNPSLNTLIKIVNALNIEITLIYIN